MTQSASPDEFHAHRISRDPGETVPVHADWPAGPGGLLKELARAAGALS
jgi:hypothetical protein